MTTEGIFKGRTISIVNDLSLDEQEYLYDKTRELKLAIREKKDLSPFIVDDPKIGIYLVFLEDSTRTKESFRNAVLFHNTKMNIFEAAFSSFNKSESYADSFRTMCGYSQYSIFIVRSKLEGVCRWLQISMQEFAQRNGLDTPSFINAGDGKHEHPTQELLDEFSFYEQKNWQRDHVHIALIGDLFHGRTTHSKVDGLKFFREVEVDLIAPHELAMPSQYIEKMKSNGFKIKEYESLEEYVKQKDLADIWYFTRLQLERMGEDVKEKANILKDAVTFKSEYSLFLPLNTKFYHPLPRHRQHPTIPYFLDKTKLNGWERQSINGYYTRIIEIAMLGGKLGKDFTGQLKENHETRDDFVKEIKPSVSTKPEYKVGIIPVSKGIVIDHIGKGDEIDIIWDHINKIRKLLNLNVIGSHGVFQSEKDKKCKGIIALPGIPEFDPRNMKKLAAIAPGCTLNLIQDEKVIHKFRINIPPKIYNFKNISCKNPDCISFPSHVEHSITLFYHAQGNTFTCGYCERLHTFKQVWDI